MGAKGGQMPSSVQPTYARQMRVSNSSFGQAIPIVYGENRVAPNLVFAFFFTAIPHDDGGALAAKGGGPSTFVQYVYAVSAILVWGEGALPEDVDLPCSSPQQRCQIGRATPGAQVLTVSDRTGEQAEPQDEDGYEPGAWKPKKVRRITDDNGDGDLTDGDDVDDTRHGFRPMRLHDFDEDPENDWQPRTGAPRFITEYGDVMSGAFRNRQSPDPSGGIQHQHTRYIELANENYWGVACSARQSLRMGSNASLPNINIPFRGLMQYRDIYAATRLNGAISDSATTITVDSTAAFPSSGTIRIDGELITYSGTTSTTFTGCARGADTTVALSHADNALVHDDGPPGHIYNADPACLVLDLLTNPKHGAGLDRYTSMLQGWPFPWGARLLTPPEDSWSAYCRAQNILLSPVLDSQRALSDILSDIAEETNSVIVWSEGMLKMIPRGTAAVTSSVTGVTFTPSTDPMATTDGANVAVRYDLTTVNFEPGKDEDAVKITRRSIVPDPRRDYKSDGFFNVVHVEYLDARNGYQVAVAEAKDDASIDEIGPIPREPYQMHAITSRQLAEDVAERILKQLIEVRNVYTFTLGWKFALLEPMDVVTLTDADADLVLQKVRITSKKEDDQGTIEFEAEDFPNDIPAQEIPPPLENPDSPVDLGSVIMGHKGTVDEANVTNPQFVDLTGCFMNYQPIQYGEVQDEPAPYWITGCVVKFHSEGAAGATAFQVSSLLRFVVDGVIREELSVLFRPEERGTTKPMTGRPIYVPAGSRVSMSITYFEEAVQWDMAANNLLGRNYREHGVNWTIEVTPA